MSKYFFLIILVTLVFSGCKSNQNAYNMAYQKLKEKNESKTEVYSTTAMSVPQEAMHKKLSQNNGSESLKLILGNEKNLFTYSIVVRSFINKTNSSGFYNQMIDKGFDALLVQNEEKMFRIIIASYPTKEEADAKLTEFQKTFPEAYVLVKL